MTGDTSKNNALMDPEELVKDISRLASLPSVCIKINKMVDENRSATEIGKAISNDVDLSARLLKIANSAFYGFASKIETITRAVTVIGDRELRSLVLATSAVEAFNKIPIDIASMASFWRHSLQCAIVSRLISSQCGLKQQEQLFLSGLLHDIGHLVLFLKCADLEKEIMVNAALLNEDVHKEEKKVLGFDHAFAGGLLLSEWGLPASLVVPVSYHHEPSLASEFKLETAIVHVANLVAKNLQQKDFTVAYDEINFDKDAEKITNFNEVKYDLIRQELPGLYQSATELFLSKEIAAA